MPSNRLIGFRRDLKAIRFQPAWAAEDLERPNTVGTHDATLQSNVVRVEAAIPFLPKIDDIKV